MSGFAIPLWEAYQASVRFFGPSTTQTRSRTAFGGETVLTFELASPTEGANLCAWS